MRTSKHAISLSIVVGLLLVPSANSVQAAVVVTASQVGPDVVFAGEGTLNTGAWIKVVNPQMDSAEINPLRFVVVGPSSDTASSHYVSPNDFAGPANFGPGTTLIGADSGIGDLFGISFFNGSETLYLPEDYMGGVLSGSATYQNETFASLDMATGTYTWTWGSGGTADSLTLNVIPEPGSALLLGVGMVALAATRRRKAICQLL